MLICLCLYHPTVTSLTKCKLLRSVFHEETYEIHVIENNTVVIYLWNAQDNYVEEKVRSFEMTNIMIGYGLGEIKAEAIDKAWMHLDEQLDKETIANSNDFFV